MHTSYFAGIDALRFVAALMVAVFHVLFWSWAGPSDLSSAMFSDKSARYPNVATIASTGWVGVEVFFVISGFVIAQSAENKTWSQYLGGRILRLFPAIWVCATVAVILALLLQVMPWKWALFSYARTLIMMPTPVWIDAVYWTLAVEITFYAMVFVLVLMKKTEKIEWLAIGLGIYTAVYLLLNQNGLLSLPDFTVAKHGVFFSIGILIWLMASQEFKWRRVILIVLFLPIALHEISIQKQILFEVTGFQQPDFLSHIIWIVATIGIGASALFPSPTYVTIRAIGLMTFPLYLLHNTVGCALLRLTNLIGKEFAAFLALTTSIALAYLVCLIEPSMRKALSRAWAHLRTPTVRIMSQRRAKI